MVPGLVFHNPARNNAIPGKVRVAMTPAIMLGTLTRSNVSSCNCHGDSFFGWFSRLYPNSPDWCCCCCRCNRCGDIIRPIRCQRPPPAAASSAAVTAAAAPVVVSLSSPSIEEGSSSVGSRLGDDDAKSVETKYLLFLLIRVIESLLLLRLLSLLDRNKAVSVLVLGAVFVGSWLWNFA
jgi:hypothetical protein